MKKILISIIIGTLTLSACSQIEKLNNIRTETTNKNIVESIKKTQEEAKKTPRTPTTKELIPNEFYIPADFICQAPLQTVENWKHHEESCEEAALLQTYNYEKSIIMTKEEANEEILKMIEWQNENFEGHHDIYADKVKELAIRFYNLKDEQIKIVYDAKIEDIKKILSEGHPIIAPVTSKYLKNPNYPHPGYHMLQIIGFNEDKIITNDNGTRKGKDYAYSTEIFETALNDAGADILYISL